MNRFAIFIAVAVAGFSTGPTAAATLLKSYSYFTIGGTTLDEIQNELAKRGPHVKSTGLRHPGATRMEFTSRVGYEQQGNSCRITSANVSVKARVILPHWRKRSKAKAAADTRFIWWTLASDIKRHEESHVVIAKGFGRQIEQALLNSGRFDNCADAAKTAQAISDKLLVQHDAEQQRFDRIEAINFERRLLALLKYRMEQVRQGRIGL